MEACACASQWKRRTYPEASCICHWSVYSFKIAIEKEVLHTDMVVYSGCFLWSCSTRKTGRSSGGQRRVSGGAADGNRCAEGRVFVR
jgi:hypothetical protein